MSPPRRPNAGASGLSISWPDAAERGFFSRWLAAAPPAPAPAARPSAPIGEGHVIGLFPEAGG